MNQNNYKTAKFAIKQNNLELLKLVLTENSLSDEQLAKCLILAKDKIDIYQELNKLIVDSSEEESEDESKDESKEESKDESKEETEEETKEKSREERIENFFYLFGKIMK